MSVIDNRIVEMQFDNSNFERNVQTSLGTLRNLNKSLDSMDTGNNLKSLASNLANMGLGEITTAVQSIADRFSTTGIIAMTVIQNVTNTVISAVKNITSTVYGLIKTGGINRALNIEKAKFMLEGLKVEWKDIADDINYAVDGTAYGLDAAANVASSLVASGVQLGDQMKAALRGVSGVAAMTNSEYAEIGSIFTTVAGQGKLMTMQLRQMEARGLNVAATMAESMGVTEAAVREMVTDGKIDFETFAKAMDDAFGEHAKDANKTFTGVMSNIRSALGRIGAMFVTPIVENESKVVTMLGSVKTKINEIKKSLEPIAEVVTDKILNGAEKITEFLDSFNIDLFKSLEPEQPNFFKPYMTQLTRADVLTSKWDYSMNQLRKTLGVLTSHMRPVSDYSDNIKRTFKGLVALFDIAKNVVIALIEPFAMLLGFGSEGAYTFTEFTAKIGDWLVEADAYISESGIMTEISGKLCDGLQWLADKFSDAKEKIGDFVSKLSEGAYGMGDLKETLSNVFGGFDFDLSGILDFISKLDPVTLAITGFNEALSFTIKVIDWVIDKAKGVGKVLGDVLTAIKDTFFSGNTGEIMKNVSIAVILYNLKNAFIQIRKLMGFIKKSPVFSLITGGNLSGSIQAIFTTFQQSMGQLNDTLMSMEKSYNSKYFLTLASAVLVLALAMKLMSTIDQDSIWTSAAVVASLMAALELMLKDFKTLSFDRTVGKGAKALIKLSSAVLILSVALKLISTISYDRMFGSLLALIAMIIALAGVAELLAKADRNLAKGTSGLIALSVAVLILSASMKVIASIDPSRLLASVIVVGALIVAMGTLAVILSKMEKNMVKGASGLLLISAGVLVLATALKVVSSVNPDRIWDSLFIVLTLLTALGLMAAGLSKLEKGIARGATGLLLISAAVLVLTAAVAILGHMDQDAMIQGLIAVAALLTAMAILAIFVSGKTNLLAIGAGLLLVAAAVGVLTVAVLGLSLLSWEQIASVVVIIAALGLGLWTLCKVLQPALLLGVAAGLLVFSAAMVVLAGAFILFSMIPLQSLTTGIVGVLAAIMLAGIAAAVLGPLAPALLAASGAMIVFGAGLAIVSGAVMLASAALVSLVRALSYTFKAINDAFTAIATVVYNLGQSIIQGICQLFGIASPSTVFMQIGGYLVMGLVNGITGGIGAAVESILTLGKGLLDGFCNLLGIHSPSTVFAGYGTNINEGLQMGIEGSSGETIAMMEELGIDMTEPIEGLPDDFYSGGTDIMDSLNSGLLDGTGDVDSTLSNLGIDMNTDVTSMSTDFFGAGSDYSTSMATGIASTSSKPTEEVKKIDTSIEQTVKSFNSKMKTLGAELSKNMASGIGSKKTSVATEVKSVVAGGNSSAQGYYTSYYETGQYLMKGLQSGINSWASHVAAEAAQVAKDAKTRVEQVTKVESPSKVFAEIGMYWDKGLIVGLQSMSDAVADTSEEVALGAIDSMNDALQNVDSILTSDITSPVIRPVMDLTDVRRGVDAIDDILGSQRDMSALVNSRHNATRSDISELVALNREILSAVKQGGNVYLNGNTLVGYINRRLGMA